MTEPTEPLAPTPPSDAAAWPVQGGSDPAAAPADAARLLAAVVTWHNRHPLARRLSVAEVGGLGTLAVPLPAVAAAAVPAGATAAQSTDATAAHPAGATAAPPAEPAAAPAWRRLLQRLPRPGWPGRRGVVGFAEAQVIPGISAARLSRFAQHQGEAERPGPAGWPQRVLAAQAGAAAPRHLFAAAFRTGPQQSRRVVIGARPDGLVLGRRQWSRARLAGATASLLLLLGAGGVGAWRWQGAAPAAATLAHAAPAASAVSAASRTASASAATGHGPAAPEKSEHAGSTEVAAAASAAAAGASAAEAAAVSQAGGEATVAADHGASPQASAPHTATHATTHTATTAATGAATTAATAAVAKAGDEPAGHGAAVAKPATTTAVATAVATPAATAASAPAEPPAKTRLAGGRPGAKPPLRAERPAAPAPAAVAAAAPRHHALVSPPTWRRAELERQRQRLLQALGRDRAGLQLDTLRRADGEVLALWPLPSAQDAERVSRQLQRVGVSMVAMEF